MMNIDIENDLPETLSKGEKLLWTGRPRTGIIFRSTDVFLVPFSLLWFGFAIFWEYNALSMGGGFFGVFGLPFIVAGFYISVGRFFVDAVKRKNTVYGITDNRVITKSGLFAKDLKSLNIRTITDLTFKEKADGSSTITFGPTDFRYAAFSGMDSWPGVKMPPALEFIDGVKKVYALIIEQQQRRL